MKRKHLGVTAVLVAVSTTVLMGMAALAIDIGIVCAAKADLQKVADAAALAAASQLANILEAEENNTTVQALAKAAARSVLKDNPVIGKDIELADTDIEFGINEWDAAQGKFLFAPSLATSGINAARITTRRTSGSSNGPLSLTFGRIFGFHEKDVLASATAILVPRDIMVIADLSGSYNDDSELRNYAENDPVGISLYEVWQTMPNSTASGDLLEAWLEANPDQDIADAPDSFFDLNPGFFSRLGSSAVGDAEVFGKTRVDSSYDPTTDSGLIGLAYATSWSASNLGSSLHSTLEQYLLDQGYSATEAGLILGATGNSSTDSAVAAADQNSVSYSSEYSTKRRYDFRVAAALGLVHWNSGLPGGRGDNLGLSGGDNDQYLDSDELVEAVDYPYAGGNWFEYAAYMRDSNNSNRAYDTLTGIKHQFGAKTFVNFLLEEKELNAETDVSHYAYANPLNLTKNAIEVLMDDLSSLDSDDRIGLVTYGAYSVLDYPIPADGTVTVEENAEIIKKLYRTKQAAHFSPLTNIGGALELGAACLDSDFAPEGSTSNWSNVDLTLCNPRPWAKKIMVLLTDGKANVKPDGSYASGNDGKDFTKRVSDELWEQSRIKVYGIGVGSGADMTTLDYVVKAATSTESGYWADGTASEIESELTKIFKKVGGSRPVQLIE
jgi:hypothetical protein